MYGSYLDGTKLSFAATEVRPANCASAKRRMLRNQLSTLCPNGHGIQAVTDCVDLADDFVNHKYTRDAALQCGCIKEISLSCRNAESKGIHGGTNGSATKFCIAASGCISTGSSNVARCTSDEFRGGVAHAEVTAAVLARNNI